jgi:fructose-1,6-bisphosphatase/inositol monophosphatase family enzyme
MKTTKIPIEKIGDILLNEIVPKAIKIIQDECHNLTIHKKVGYDGIKEDLATNGDKMAQAMYMKELAKHFPNFGVIAEEDGVAFNGTDTDGDDIYFTVDPLDGTKAYERGSSQGVGTMIALIKNDQVISAYIGDANTGEIYGYAGLETRGDVIRRRFGVTTNLKPNITHPLSSQYALLRNPPRKQPALINKLTDCPENGGLFKNIEVSGGSIGTAFSKLWKGEVGAIVLEPNFDTPWDLAPIIGICRRLGFKFYKVEEDTSDTNKFGTLVENEPKPVKTVTEKPYTEFIIHETYKQEIELWLKQN